MAISSWNDLEEILFNGTPDQINAVTCPECGGRLRMFYYPETRNMQIFCKDCGTVIRAHGCEKTPNFALLPQG